MPLIELAEAANLIATMGNDPNKEFHHRVTHDYMSSEKIFDTVKETVAYVGCGQELSSIFLFPNASRFVHQDVSDTNLRIPLKQFQEANLITDYSIEEKQGKRIHKFTLLGNEKTLLEVLMDVEKGVPNEARENLGAIYFFAVPYPHVIRNLQRRLLPHLKIGGLFEGPYPYASGEFEGAKPEKIGLEQVGGTFVKVRNVTHKEVAEIHRNNPYFKSGKNIPGW